MKSNLRYSKNYLVRRYERRYRTEYIMKKGGFWIRNCSEGIDNIIGNWLAGDLIIRNWLAKGFANQIALANCFANQIALADSFAKGKGSISQVFR